MDIDKPSQEGREDVPNELSFLVSGPEADATPVVTRSSEMTRPEPTSPMVTRSRAREGRGISVAPEVPIEPEVETRPEPEIAICEEGLGAARSYPTDTASLFTFSDKPEILTICTSQEITETSQFTAVQSQTFQSDTSDIEERQILRSSDFMHVRASSIFNECQNRFPHWHQPMNRDRRRNQPHRPYGLRW